MIVFAQDTRVLQSHIRTSSEVSSITPLDIDLRRVGLALGSFIVAAELGTVDSNISFREDEGRHNLVGKWKVFQEEVALLEVLGR